jgi:hypothetical protein
MSSTNLEIIKDMISDFFIGCVSLIFVALVLVIGSIIVFNLPITISNLVLTFFVFDMVCGFAFMAFPTKREESNNAF